MKYSAVCDSVDYTTGWLSQPRGLRRRHICGLRCARPVSSLIETYDLRSRDRPLVLGHLRADGRRLMRRARAGQTMKSSYVNL